METKIQKNLSDDAKEAAIAAVRTRNELISTLLEMQALSERYTAAIRRVKKMELVRSIRAGIKDLANISKEFATLSDKAYELSGIKCAYCGGPAQGNYSLHRDGFCQGPEVDLCDHCGSRPTPTCEQIWERIAVRKDRPHKTKEAVRANARLEEQFGHATRRIGDLLKGLGQ